MQKANRLGSFLMGALIGAVLIGVIYGSLHLTRDNNPDTSERTTTPGTEKEPVSPIDCAWYRKTSEFDPGTIRVYIRNTSDSEWRFKQVLLDGLPIPVWGVDEGLDINKPDLPPDEEKDGEAEHTIYAESARRFSGKRVIWARLAPATIPPGAIGEFMAKLANPMPWPMKVEFVPHTGEELSTVVHPVQPALAITMVTFAEDLRTVYLYLKGNRDKPVNLHKLEVNGKILSRKDTLATSSETESSGQSDSLWLSSGILEEGMKQVAVVTLREPLAQGDFILLKVNGMDGEAVEERIRVFTGFSINAEGSGPSPSGFGLDPNPCTYRPGYLKHKAPEVPSSFPKPTSRCNYIFECAMHTFAADHRRSAQEILRRYELCLQNDPYNIICQHLCRIRPETGYALFGEIADIIRTNPNITTGLSESPPKETDFEAVARISRYACETVAPRRVHIIAHSTPFGETRGRATPEQVRRRIYALLGTGVKGVLYRHYAWRGEKPAEEALNNEIRRSNAEMDNLRRYLAIADVVDWVKVKKRTDVNAYSLLAGPDALLLIILHHEPETTSDKGNSTGEPVKLSLDLPEWFLPGEIMSVSPEGLENLGITTPTDGEVTLPAPSAASAFLIRRAKP